MPSRWQRATSRSGEGESLELIVAGDGLALEQSGVRRSLRNSGDEGSFTVVGAKEKSSSLLVRTQEGKVQSVGWGRQTLYMPEGQAPLAPLPHELQQLAGIYDSDDPWNGQREVVARPDGLWLDGTEPLTLMNDGSFRVGHDDWAPDRVRFDGDLDGRPSRLVIVGCGLHASIVSDAGDSRAEYLAGTSSITNSKCSHRASKRDRSSRALGATWAAS